MSGVFFFTLALAAKFNEPQTIILSIICFGGVGLCLVLEKRDARDSDSRDKFSKRIEYQNSHAAVESKVRIVPLYAKILGTAVGALGCLLLFAGLSSHISSPALLVPFLLCGLVSTLMFTVVTRPVHQGESIRGLVRHFQDRPEVRGTVWVWVVMRNDSSGNPLPPVAVQMKGKSADGVLNEGDDVEVGLNRWKRGILSPKRVFNHSTQSWFRVRR